MHVKVTYFGIIQNEQQTNTSRFIHLAWMKGKTVSLSKNMDTILNKIHVPIDQMFIEDPGHLSHSSAFLPVYNNNCTSWVIFTVAHFLHNLSFQAENIVQTISDCQVKKLLRLHNQSNLQLQFPNYNIRSFERKQVPHYEAKNHTKWVRRKHTKAGWV